MALRVGRIKRAAGHEIHAPEREADVLGRVCLAADGPLGGEAVERLFRAIIAETRAAESRETATAA